MNLPINTNVTLQAMQKLAKADATQDAIQQDASQEAFMERTEEASNPLAYKKLTKKSLTERKSRISKAEKAEKSSGSSEKAAKAAAKFEKRNPELSKKMLMLLRENMKEGDSSDEILEKVLKFYDDPAIADEALEFLEETTDGELKEQVKEAKEKLLEDRGREVKAGRNMGAQARAFSKKGLGSPTALRDLYRDLTGNPKDARSLFDELSGRFKSFKELKDAVKFFFHSLGADMKSQGPSIPRGLLLNLVKQTRALQAMVGMFNFFKGRMGLMKKMFKKSGVPFPEKLTFEKMAKEFMKFVGERYPSSDKAMQMAKRLGVDKWIAAKIIALTQMRDAIRQMASQYIYKSGQHRDDLLMALIEALEDLEDELEEYLGEQEEELEEEDEINKKILEDEINRKEID